MALQHEAGSRPIVDGSVSYRPKFDHSPGYPLGAGTAGRRSTLGIGSRDVRHNLGLAFGHHTDGPQPAEVDSRFYSPQSGGQNQKYGAPGSQRGLAGRIDAGCIRFHHLSYCEAERGAFPVSAVYEFDHRSSESWGRNQGPALEGGRGLCCIWPGRSLPAAASFPEGFTHDQAGGQTGEQGRRIQSPGESQDSHECAGTWPAAG